MEISTNGTVAKDWLEQKFYKDQLNNQDLVSIIILLFSLLNLKTIMEYKKLYNKTYRGVKQFNKNVVEISGKQYVIDND
jgi:hypothetical protein